LSNEKKQDQKHKITRNTTKDTCTDRENKGKLDSTGSTMTCVAVRLQYRAVHCIVVGRRVRERHLRAWIDDVKEDFKAMKFDVREAVN